MPTTESLNDIVSRIVLQHNMVEEEQLEEALALQREILESDKKKPSLERVLLDMGIIRGKQLKGLRYAIIYYLVRKADRFYAKIAVQSDICELKWVNEALKEQKRIHLKEHRLVRINKILIEKGYINAREDRAILRAIEGLRERRRKRKEGGKGRAADDSGSDVEDLAELAALSGVEIEGTKSEPKGKKKPAANQKAPAGLSDEELEDLEDLGEDLDELSQNKVDETVGVKEDDPQSLQELEALSGIGDSVKPQEVEVDDTAEVEDSEVLTSGSSLGEIDEELAAPADEDDPGDDEAADEAARTAGSGSEAGSDEDDLADLDDEAEDEEDEEEEEEEEDDAAESQDDDLGDLDDEPAKAKSEAKPAPAAKGKAAKVTQSDPVIGGATSSSSSDDLEDVDLDEDGDDGLDDLDDEDEDEADEDEMPAGKKAASKKAPPPVPARGKDDEDDSDDLEDEDEAEDEDDDAPAAKKPAAKKGASSSEEEDEDEAEGSEDEAKDEEASEEEAEAEDEASEAPAKPAPEPKKKGLFGFLRRDKAPPPAKRPASGGAKRASGPQVKGKDEKKEEKKGGKGVPPAPRKRLGR